MKKNVSNILRIPARIALRIRGSSVHSRVFVVVIICALCIGLYFLVSRQSDKTFELEFATYSNLASDADNAAYIPGAQGNPIRVALDQALTQVLDQSIHDPQRLQAANDGLTILKQSVAQIDSISSTTAKVDALIAKMQVDTLSDPASSDKARSIIALAKSRESIISDIRAYSYKTDFEISQIFTTVVAANGALTNSYIIQLNNEIPDVETEFDKRSSLYAQLQTIAQKIVDTYTGTIPTSPSGS